MTERPSIPQWAIQPQFTYNHTQGYSYVVLFRDGSGELRLLGTVQKDQRGMWAATFIDDEIYSEQPRQYWGNTRKQATEHMFASVVIHYL